MGGETLAPQWKQLYAVAMLKLDPANLQQRINDAHQAILDRVEELHTSPSDGEQHGLNDALQSLRILRIKAWSGLWQSGQEANLAKNRQWVPRNLFDYQIILHFVVEWFPHVPTMRQIIMLAPERRYAPTSYFEIFAEERNWSVTEHYMALMWAL